MRTCRSLTAAVSLIVAPLLSGCILFPPFWAGPLAPEGEIVVENATGVDWVVEITGDIPIGFAVGADQVGSMGLYGGTPSEVILRTPDCEEADRITWDGTAAAFRIEEPGALAPLSTAPGEDVEPLVGYGNCLETTSGAPQAGDPLAEAGGKILITALDGSAYALDVSEGTVTPIGPVPEAGSIAMDTEHQWSPSGDRLAFAREGMGDGVDGTYVANGVGGEERLLVEYGGIPRWSPDGSWLAYIDRSAFTRTWGLALADVNSGGIRRLAVDATTPAWSPNGERIAFYSFSDFQLEVPEPAELLIVNADGSTEAQTLAANAYPYAPAPSWSPDGTRLAFIAVANDGDSDAVEGPTVLAIHDLESGETTELLRIEDASVTDASWSRDGESIAVTVDVETIFGPTGSVALVDAETGELTPLDEGQGVTYTYPVWSPDGDWLLFTRYIASGGTASIIAIRPDGSGEHTLATHLLAAAQWIASPAD